MPYPPHHTLPALPEQLQTVINEGWEQEVLPQLPANYEQQAQVLGAFVRQREIKGVADLLRALLAYVLCAPSFRQLGWWAVLVGLTNISNVAWRGRLRQGRAWLLWLQCDRHPSQPAARATAAHRAHRCDPAEASPGEVEMIGGCIWAMICWGDAWSGCG